ncbi:MAG: FAD-dependent oxidoreductase [Rhodospirillales bacterium]|nr:FAD-dependent oxidoreductase [Rhodospirillales bacterium]
MARDPRYDVLFEPVKIGPVTAPNRFYQVPHCSGMGHQMPQTVNAMRGVKAEGGWGVVCTEYCSIDPSSDDGPHAYCTLWDDDDIRNQAAMVEAVHRHGSLAGVELWHGGYSSDNGVTRRPPTGPNSMPVWHGTSQTRAMDKADIRTFRENHRKSALRAREAGFDIVYVYAAHGYLPAQFLSPIQNQRTDEYGGSFENRARLIRELLEDTGDAVGDTCAVAIRFAVDNLDVDMGITRDGDGRALVEYVAELPDLWDVNIANFAADARTARFAGEGAQEDYIAFVKQVTTRPVLTVGRYTSADRMVAIINKGLVDMIGSARPSIADPFLPRKIEEGRIEDVRECIGCNVCIKSNNDGWPLRCTQNPTMGEEWRRGWHPERIAPKGSDGKVLIVGAGPAGLEAARAAGQRGYQVALAEATGDLGGRSAREATLPGLSTFARVRDWRLGQIARLPNVEVFRDSRLDAEQVLEFGFEHVCIATGSRWRHNGMGRSSFRPFDGHGHGRVFTPDDVMEGSTIEGRVMVYDDDHFYMGGVIAEALKAAGNEVVLVTSADSVSPSCHGTLDQPRIQARLIALEIAIVTAHRLLAFDGSQATLACVYSGRERKAISDNIVVVTSREPSEGLYLDLASDPERLAEAGIGTLARAGDCEAPNMIATAVHAGHLFARTLDGNDVVLRDRVAV